MAAPLNTAASPTATETSSTAEPSSKLTYNDFVKKFFSKTDAEMPKAGKERMRICGREWRKYIGKPPKEDDDTDGPVSKVDSDSGVSKAKMQKKHVQLVIPEAPTTFNQLANIFKNIRKAGTDGESDAAALQSFSRSAAFSIQRTRKNQRAIRGGIKAFQSSVKKGSAPTAEAAFLRGANLIIDLAR